MADLDVAVRLKFLTQGKDQIKAAAKDLAAFGKASSKLSSAATGRFSGDLTKAWRASAKLGGALDKSAVAASRTAGALNRIGAEARDIDRTRAAVDRLSKSTRNFANAEAKVRASTSRGAAGAAIVAGGMGGALVRRRAALREGFAEAASHVTPNGYLVGASGAVMVGAALGGTVASIGGAMAYGTKQAVDFERAMADVKKKVTLDAGATWSDVEQEINRVSREMGISRVETAALTAMAGQAGVEFKDLTAFMRLAAKAAVAWDIPAGEASLHLAKIKAGMGATIPELQDFADKVNALGDSSASSERNILDMFKRVAGSAKAANVPLDTSLAVTTALDSIGMEPEIASRFFNAFSSKMRTAATGGRGAKDAADGYKMLGLSLQEVEKGMKTDATKTIIDVLERLETSPDKAAAAIKILGQEWWDEAARSGQALKEIIKNLTMLYNGSWRGSVDRNMTVNLSTTANHLERFKSLVSEIGDGMMRWALPPINSKLDSLLKSYERVNQGPGLIYSPTEKEANARLDEARKIRPTGRSIWNYEAQNRLDRPIARAPGAAMFAQIEGATPHLAQARAYGKPILDTSAFGPNAERTTNEANDLYSALEKLNTTVQPVVDASASIGALNAIAGAARAAAGAMNALRTFGTPGAGVRVAPSLTGGRGAGGSSGGGASPATPAATTPGKQARAGGRGVQIANAHFHGVRDARAMYRQLAALEARRIRSSRDAALHDLA